MSKGCPHIIYVIGDNDVWNSVKAATTLFRICMAENDTHEKLPSCLIITKAERLVTFSTKSPQTKKIRLYVTTTAPHTYEFKRIVFSKELLSANEK